MIYLRQGQVIAAYLCIYIPHYILILCSAEFAQATGLIMVDSSKQETLTQCCVNVRAALQIVV